MRRGCPLFLRAVGLIVLGALTTHAEEAAIVHFPDKNLEAAIRKAIHKPEGDILQTDLVGTGFTWIMAHNVNITDLTGLEYCTDLMSLYLFRNQICDVSALAKLTGLRFLNLDGNQIGDLSPLAGLRDLHYLSLDSNQISDLSPLAGLLNLVDLEFDNNRISDISAVADLPNLQHLGLGGNPIRGIRPWITVARIECRAAWIALGPTGVALLVVGATLFLGVLVVLRVWSRRVSKRYTREP